jgi:hypothetical protein
MLKPKWKLGQQMKCARSELESEKHIISCDVKYFINATFRNVIDVEYTLSHDGLKVFTM